MTKQELIANFVDSLEQERNALGLTQAQMASELELSLSGYKKLIAGETSRIDLYVAYRMYQITGKWFFELCKVDSPIMNAVRLMKKLTPYQIRFVTGILDFESQFLQPIDSDKEKNYVTLLIPTGSFADGMIWDSANVDKINVSTYRKRFGEELNCAILITSTHLHPVYNQNDILLISKSAPRDGDIGIFINKETGRAYIRKYYDGNPNILEPVNHYGEKFILDVHNADEMSKWIKFGRVLTKIRQ